MDSSPEKKPEVSDQSGEDKTRHRWREHLSPGRVLGAVLVVLIALGGAGYGHFTDPGPLVANRAVVIPHGGTQHVAETLQREGVLTGGWFSSLFFRLSVLATSRQGGIHAAELSFPARVSIAHTLQILRYGRPISHSLTIAEGLTAAHIRDVLQHANALNGPVPSFEEGSVLPQTLFYRWGTERQALVQRLQSLMVSSLGKTWEQRDQAALQNVITTPQQLLVLASLIERETSVPEERPRVARVFINRLKKGMRLQTDPTVIYALSQGQGNLDRPLTHDDLEVDSPYNTYLHAGLPPGAICSPGLEALEAAAHPTSGDELYFVATGHGGHSFSKTLSEQTEHLRSYRRLRHSSP